MPQFLLNHDSFLNVEATADNVAHRLGVLLGILTAARESPFRVAMTDNCWFAQVTIDFRLDEILFDPNDTILEYDVRIAFQQVLNGITELSCDTVDDAVGNIRANRDAVGLISCPSTFECENTDGIVTIRKESEILNFYRQCFEIEDVNADRFFELGTLAFPGLEFALEHTRFNRFSGNYRDLRRVSVVHLAAVNDGFRRIHGECAGHAANVENAFRAEYHVDISKESDNTHRNKAAMHERNVKVGAITHCCEWHTKFEKTKNRIHFDPSANPDIAGKILIGIFVDHLTV
ncbi:MAG TPA: hypothetical protein VGK19_25910 [Capsulimonadaceae bacterium]|jgi:hypothetical protein